MLVIKPQFVNLQAADSFSYLIGGSVRSFATRFVSVVSAFVLLPVCYMSSCCCCLLLSFLPRLNSCPAHTSQPEIAEGVKITCKLSIVLAKAERIGKQGREDGNSKCTVAKLHKQMAINMATWQHGNNAKCGKNNVNDCCSPHGGCGH